MTHAAFFEQLHASVSVTFGVAEVSRRCQGLLLRPRSQLRQFIAEKRTCGDFIGMLLELVLERELDDARCHRAVEDDAEAGRVEAG